MDLFNSILFWINNGVIAILSLAFGIQMIYILFFFLKAKKYPKAEIQHKFAIIIAAKNEKNTIGKSVECILNKLNYPRDKYDVFVVADNCTDDTAMIATQAGAIVIERNDITKVSKGYALEFAFNHLLSLEEKYEAYCIFDADTIPHKEYLNYMNDAFEAGESIANCFLDSQNWTQNISSGVSSLWYLRDCRFSCHTRSAIGLPCMLSGHGIMIANSVIEEIGGWDSVGLLEDAEFTINRVLEGKKIGYVKDAIIYDDNPSKVSDTFKRNIRMGNGLSKLFFDKGGSLLKNFFCSFKFKYLDMFLTLMFAPIAVIAVIWFPLYYIYSFAYLGFTDWAEFLLSLNYLWKGLLFAFIIPFIGQGILVMLLEWKKFKGKNKLKIFIYTFFLPLYMIIYALGITCGVCRKKVEWKNVSRNVDFIDNFKIKDNAKDRKTLKLNSFDYQNQVCADIITADINSEDIESNDIIDCSDKLASADVIDIIDTKESEVIIENNNTKDS